MVAYTKFDSTVEAMAEKKHNFGADVLKVALTNTAPVAANTVLADITEAAYTFCSARTLTVTNSSQVAGLYSLTVSDLTLTASGGVVGPFRYIVVYNDTATNDELIGWFDRGNSITLADTETVLLDFAATLLTLQ